jgi:membrane-associated phospholipid phosphatase
MDQGRRSRVRRLTRALVYAVVVAVPLGVLAFLVRSKFGPLADLDQDVIVAATGFTRSHSRFRTLATDWESLSQPWVVYSLIGLPACAVAWFRFHLRTRVFWAVGTMATGWGVATALKYVVQRARPVIADPFAVHAGYSFPSGHATNNAIVITVVLLLLRPILGDRARGWLLAVGALWLFVTCADRVYMGAHFPSDVAAGVLLGCGLCAASYAGYTGWSPPPITTDTSNGVT